MPKYETVARFHLAHKGQCLVRVGTIDPPVFLEQGDLIVIPHGETHKLYCDPITEHVAELVDDVVERTGFNGTGALVIGEKGTDHETQLICGHFAFDPDFSHILLAALPPYIHIKNYGASETQWLEATLRLIGTEAQANRAGSHFITVRMSEIIFAQAVRYYAFGEGSAKSVFAGLANERLSRALSAFHAAPAQKWSVELLANVAGMSRTAFSDNFSAAFETTPMNYVTNWRLQIAAEKLRDSNAAVIDVAEVSGYNSEQALIRAFKGKFGETPARYRRLKQTAGA